jgi:filamentous hemagglutinin family protein
MKRLGRTFRRSTAYVSSLSLVLAPFGSQFAFAQSVLPQGGFVVGGSATISQPSAGALNINQSSQRAIINWNSFSVGQPNSVNFSQPNSSASILNRVTGSTPSSIAGQINANGQVYLVNPNGIAITPSGTVTVGGGFVASTLDIANSDFMAGNLLFRGNGASAGVSNQGAINAANGGFVALLGGMVSNTGTISVPLGKVGIGSGEQVTLDLNGDGFMQVAIPTSSTTKSGRSLLEVAGSVQAAGGKIEISAATVAKAIRDAVNVTGSLSATSMSGRDGSVVLGGGPGGNVKISGSIDTSGAAGAGRILTTGANVDLAGARLTTQSLQGTGGSIIITAAGSVSLSGSTLDASGGAGGGAIRLGGDFKGLGTIGTAAATAVDERTTIKADALLGGAGGTIVLWSGQLTSIAGKISAKGGAQGGNGGTVEISSKGKLEYRGVTDLSAVKGQTGTLLLDPDDYVVNAAEATAIVASLATANVIIQTTAGGVGGNGDITINAPINWASANSFTASAYRHIFVNANIGNTGGAGVVLYADNSGTGIGTLSFGVGNTVSTAGPVSIFYNPSSYATPTDYTPNVVGTTPTAYMLVNDVNQLQAVNTNLAGTYALGRNIDAAVTAGWNGGAGFVPLGNGGTPFTGQFNGQNYPVAGLFIDRPATDFVGLFGRVGLAGMIQNVGLVGGSVSGHAYVGALAGESLGSVTNSYATGNVAGATQFVGGLVGALGSDTVVTSLTNSYATGDVSGGDRVGGLIGVIFPASTVTQSYATGNVTGTGANENRWIGGLAGVNDGIITQSYATGDVTAPTSTSVGGLVGYNWSGGAFATIISNSYATGNVVGSNQSTGGLVGDNYFSTVKQSYATGNVAGFRDVGGLVGRNQSGLITQSYATGAVSADTYYNPGGLVGYNDPGSTISYSYALGSVTLIGTAQWAGGLVGWNDGTIIQSYASGLVSGPPAQYVGGFAGSIRGTILQSYWDATTTGQVAGFGQDNGGGGTFGASALQSNNPAGADYAYKTAAYAGWNFGTSPLGPSNNCTGACWVIVDNKGTFNNAGGATSGATRPFGLWEYTTAIKNSHELQLAALDLAASYTLAKNIDLGPALAADIGGNYPGMWSAAGFVPIGNATAFPLPAGTPFAGTFDGRNFTIGNLKIDRPAASGIGDYVGLFGFNTGTIRNVNLTGVNVAGGDFAVGGLVGYNGFIGIDSLVQNVNVTGTVGASPTGGIDVGYVGGLAGLNRGTISLSSADVTATGNNYVGGLVGSNHNLVSQSQSAGTISGNTSIGGLSGYNWNGLNGIGTITQSSSTASVSGVGNLGGLLGYNDNGTVMQSNASGGVSGIIWAGGLVGYNSFGIVSQSSASGAVTAPNTAGGLVGYNDNGTIAQSSASGAVNGDSYVGGLVGFNVGVVSGSSASGTVGGIIQVGGLVGWNDMTGSVALSYATGNVGGSIQIGGLVGHNNYGTISQSYATGVVIGSMNVGGLAGSNFGTIQNVSYATGNVSGRISVGGLVGGNSGNVSQSYATGAVTGIDIPTGSQYIGGLIGFHQIGSVTDSYATGPVTGHLVVGGLVGYNDGTIQNASHSIGAVNGNLEVGGLVGLNGFTGTISQSTASGNVVGFYNHVGGLVGQNFNVVTQSSVTGGTVTGNAAVGGLVGWNLGSITLSNVAAGVVVTDSGANTDGPSGFIGGLVGYNGFDPGFVGTISQSSSGATVTASAFGRHIGGLVGYNANGLVTLSFATGTVTGFDEVGGLVGWNGVNGNVTLSYATGAVTGTAGAAPAVPEGGVGGLAGRNSGSISYSYATLGTITGFDDVGGLVGQNNAGASILRSFAANTVIGSENHIGGLVGVNSGLVTLSYTASTVSGHLAVGGLVGWNRGTITQSYAEGPVAGDGYLGGLVGYNGHDSIATIADAYATGSVTGSPGSQFVGGLVGNNNFGSTVMRTYAAGAVGGTTDVGGLVGFNDVGSSVTMSYWDTQTTGLASGIGSNLGTFSALGLTTAQLQDLSTFQTTYTGWDFFTIWSPPNRVGQSGYAVAHYPQLYSVNNDAVWVKADDVARQYGDPNPPFTANYYGLNAGDALVTPVTLSSAATPSSNVGNYLIEASPLDVTGASGTNYRVIYTGALTVDPRMLTASLIGTVSKVYDGNTTATLTAANYDLSGVVLGDTVNVTNFTPGSYDNKNVTGSPTKLVTVLGVGLDNGNYVLSSSTVSGNVGEITPKTLTASLIGTVSKVYDGNTTATLTAANYDLSGVVLGDTVNVTNFTPGSYDNKNVTGSPTKLVTVLGVGLDNGNYVLSSSTVSGNVGEITPAIITVAGAAGVNKIYDTTTALPPGATGFDYSGVLPADALNVTVAATSAVYDSPNVGPRNINVTGLNLTGIEAGNYQLSSSSVTGSGTIGAAALTYSVADVTFTFGMLPSPGMATLTGVLPGDTVTPVVGVFDSSNTLITLSTTTPVGAYAERVIGLGGPSGGNYIIAGIGNTDGILTIQAAGDVQSSIVANALGNNGANGQGAGGAGNQNCTPGGIADQFKQNGSAVIFDGVGMGCGNP